MHIVEEERRNIPIVTVHPRREDLLVMGDARLNERRREKTRKSSSCPPPFNSSSSQCGLPLWPPRCVLS